ncbi:PRD domain-containing protein [Alkalispirochaeta americana]|uniref:PRD domain-containing protein n=1 Tax=Alkalispirochaeta americana TaxID=159291 RepID=A0A1N6XR32_9SPIO|nr:PRD domain-containing protein [Alkalispirochaeta americana]SIR04806.1 PRD domain-containing protein [Alkalispirochaeta americana]
MSLDFRLGLLEQSGQMSSKVKENIEAIRTFFIDDAGIELIEENGSRFITHVVMALGRIEREEPVEALDDEAFEEFKESDVFEKATDMTDRLVGILSFDIPESEIKYFIINICLILDED